MVFVVLVAVSIVMIVAAVVKIVTVVLSQNKLEIWGKAQRESARRPKSDWWKLRGWG